MRPASAALLCAALASAFAADPGADVVRVYNLPGTKECETDALKVCSMVVRMCASDETECELQCRSTQPPQISDACKATHPCAPDAENFCSDMAPGAIMACLKSNRDALAPTCKESDPCLANADVACPENKHAAAGVMPFDLLNQVLPIIHAPFRPFHGQRPHSWILPSFDSPMIGALPGAPLAQRTASAQACECVEEDDEAGDPAARLDRNDDAETGGTATVEQFNALVAPASAVTGCSEHLDHEFCRPCGENCVANPFCGVGKSWCRVRGGSKCSLPLKQQISPPGCVGPYGPSFPQCEARIAAALAAEAAQSGSPATPVSLTSQVVLSAPAPDSAEPLSDTLQRRCRAQERIFNQGFCPRPSEEQLASAANPPDPSKAAWVRHCNSRPVESLGSFLRHVMDAMRPAIEEAGEDAAQAMSELAAATRNHSLAALLNPKTSRPRPPSPPPPSSSSGSANGAEVTPQVQRFADAAAIGSGAGKIAAADGAVPSGLASSSGIKGPVAHVPEAMPAPAARGGVGKSTVGAEGATVVVSHADSGEGEGGGSDGEVCWLVCLPSWAVWGGAIVLVVAGLAWFARGGRAGSGRSHRGKRPSHRTPQWSGSAGAFGGSAPFEDDAGPLGADEDADGLFEPFHDEDLDTGAEVSRQRR
ncbi:hypothetical protein FNF27_03275 [Cafeteria roenbergensis]|uniref:FZ domain-containing protein n=1 Tax=Cafeteria roenbergensis TaxID=33653 RepID=A0A5A8EEX3_CAFRO|nr:hypothetical protein FNF27_03275 [Cafeteria roenbergensis]